MIFKIDDPVYGRQIVVALDETDVRIVSAFKRYGFELDDEFRALMQVNGNGRTVLDTVSQAHLVRLKEVPSTAQDVGVLVHELTHAAIQIFGRIGQPINSENDEPFAYYLQFLVRTCLQKIPW